jgi:hypothetical protein
MPGGIRGPEWAETYSGHVVWDFRSGTEVAAWRPSTQQTAWLHMIGGAGLPDFSVVISPLGNYVAELQGDGQHGDELHIYQIP